MASGAYNLVTEFADGRVGLISFVNVEGHLNVLNTPRLIGTPKVTNVTVKNTKGNYIDGQEYFINFIMPGSDNLPIEQQHEPDTLRQSFVYWSGTSQEMNVMINLKSLEQFKTLGMYAYDFDGNVLPDANGQIYDSLGTSLGFVTFNSEGYAEVRGLPTESKYTMQVAAPSGRSDLRNIENEIYVTKRETLNDTLVVNPYFGLIPGDETHKFMLPTNPDDYFATDSTGTPYNISGLSMNDVLEGQVENVENTDGRVVSDWVMGRPIAIYGANSEQLQKMEDYAQIFLGNKNFNDYFTVVGTARSPPNTDYNYLTGDVDGGINWGVDGNNTETWEKDMYNNDGRRNAYMVSGGMTNAISEPEHELGWYSHVNSVNSRPSIMNDMSDHSNIPTDAFVLQYVLDAKTKKFADGLFTGEMSDYRTEVPSFKSNNPNNILRIK